MARSSTTAERRAAARERNIPDTVAPEEAPRKTLKRLHVRPATLADRSQVQAILKRYRLEPGFDGKEFCIVEHRGKVAGCARLRFLGDGFELASVGVKGSYQRRGIGSLLVRQCLEVADGEVFCLTDRPEFFRRFGFREIGPDELPAEVLRKLKQRCPPGATSMRHAGNPRRKTYRVLQEKCARDLETTKRALEKVRIAVPPRSHYRKVAEDFLNMARSYFSDAKHFLGNGDLVNAFASVNYAHGWLDAGARLGLFDVGLDDKLFTLAE